MARGPESRSWKANLSRTGIIALAALVLARSAVSFEFQSVTALVPILERSLALAPTEFGVLLGIYMAPGVATTIAGPYLAGWLGRAGLLYVSLCLMAVGQIALLYALTVELAYASRLLAGLGGCVVYSATISLVAELEGSGQLAFRMGMIAASWPFGNALALLLLGGLAINSGKLVGFVPVLGIALAAILVPIAFRAMSPKDLVREHSRSAAGANEARLSLGDWSSALRAMLKVSLCFALYNVGFIVITSFSPSILEGLGLTRSTASAVSSLPMWVFILSVPLGGVVATSLGLRDGALVVFGCLGAAVCFLMVPLVEERWIFFSLAGLIGGFPTAPILARAAETMRGMSAKELSFPALFFVFFVTLLAVPPLIGWTIELTGNPFMAIYLAAAMLVLSVGLYPAMHRVRKKAG